MPWNKSVNCRLFFHEIVLAASVAMTKMGMCVCLRAKTWRSEGANVVMGSGRGGIVGMGMGGTRVSRWFFGEDSTQQFRDFRLFQPNQFF